MRQFIDVTGKTEEEAINRALEQLKLDRDRCIRRDPGAGKGRFPGSGKLPCQGPGQLR